MMRIGITGGIGSGKTTIASIFKLLGVPVYNSDERAKWLMNADVELRKNIELQFGVDAFHPDQTINKAYLARRVFNNREELDKLNQLVHPAVAKDFLNWSLPQKTDLVMQEAALIFEAGIDKFLDAVIVVDCPDELRIQRVITRSGMSRAEVEARIAHQLPSSALRARANWIINNDECSLVIPQVVAILSHIRTEGIRPGRLQ
jgi:dephospho-CoA kinase